MGNVQNAVAWISCPKRFTQVIDMKSLGNKEGGAHCHLTRRLVSFWVILHILFNFEDNWSYISWMYGDSDSDPSWQNSDQNQYSVYEV